MSPLPRALRRALYRAPREDRADLLRLWFGAGPAKGAGTEGRAAVARQLARTTRRLGVARTAAVCRLAIELDPPQQAAWLRAAGELGPALLPDDADPEAFDAARGDPKALAWFHRELQAGRPRDLLLLGLTLADRESMRLASLGPGCRAEGPEAAERAVLFFNLGTTFHPRAKGRWLFSLFQALAKAPDAVGPLLRLADPVPAAGLAGIAILLAIERAAGRIDQGQLACLADRISGQAPEDRYAYADLISGTLGYAIEKRIPEARFALTLEFADRLMAKAKGPGRVGVGAWPEFLGRAEVPLLRTLAEAGEAALLALRDAFADFDAAPACFTGLASLHRDCPGLLAEGLAACPARLLRAARALGTLRPGRTRALTAAYRAHPLARLGTLGPLTPEALAPLLASLARGPANPVSRRLRDHLEGWIRLPAPSLVRHLDRARTGLTGARLDLLARLALEDAAARIPTPPPAPGDAAATHAVWMTERVAYNRRPLRRLVAARLAGQLDARRDHPRSRDWLDRKGAPDPDLWLTGIRQQTLHPTHGPIELALETDPLEILRMGSHVQSCLGLYGANAHGAAAAALDVNKQVVYARDRKGRVVGRQLLALDRGEGLVCFYVYPEGSDRALETAFKDYDLAFAAALGVEIRLPDEPGQEPRRPRLERLVARRWYDDGAWSLVVAD